MHRQLLIVGLVALVASLVSAKGEANFVQEKLKAFARMTKGQPTRLTYEDYLNANRDIKENYTQEQLEALRLKSPQFRLFQDFVLTPMERWRPAVMDDEVVHEAYVRRMELTFKRFWPAYVDQRQIGGLILFNGKFLHFVKTMRKQVKEEPTIEEWEQVAKEYETIKSRAEEMVRHEDIYEMLDDYEYKLNYFNNFGIKYIMENYASRLNECKTTDEMRPIIADFRKVFRVR